MDALRTKILDRRRYWFTVVEHPEIEPTNNAAEQWLR